MLMTRQAKGRGLGCPSPGSQRHSLVAGSCVVLAVIRGVGPSFWLDRGYPRGQFYVFRDRQLEAKLHPLAPEVFTQR